MDEECEYSMPLVRQIDDHCEVQCEPCTNHGTLVQAEEFCVDCSLYLCDKCFENHQKQNPSKKHLYCVLHRSDDETLGSDRDIKIIESSEDSEGTVADDGQRDLESEKCVEHFEKFFEYYCESCKQLCCSECLEGPHKTCSNIKSILDVVLMNRGKMGEELLEIEGECVKLAVEKEHFDNTIESNLKATTARRMLALKELKNARENIDKWFDNLEKRIEKEMEKVEMEDKERIKTASDQEKCLKFDTEKILSEITALKNQKHIKREQFIAMKIAREQIEEIRAKRETFRKDARIRLYDFNTSNDVKVMMESICEMGELTFKDSEMKAVVELEEEVAVCSSKDKRKPLIVGLTEVSEHFLVLLDAEVDESCSRPIFQNNSVIVIDLAKNEVACEVAMETSIFGVTKVKRNQIAITMKVEKKIQLMMVMDSGSLVKGRQIDAGGECIGIICSGEDLIVSYIDKIQILNRKGDVLKKIEAANLFQYPDSLSISPDQETIYVSDMSMNSVTAMTLNGKVKSIYKASDLKFPSTVTVDSDGRVFVCSTGTKCIHQLTEDCCHVQTLDIAGASIAFSNKGHKLYIGLFDKVQVYGVTY